ncbi:phage portal protein, HK97 family [Lysinibacillus sp. AC-3]|uniref:phage portal protein n=1 Tax=unclassified Lysinibacillus TaxID=2636778 RepID=UPI0009D10A30|nr:MULTISPECIES: phage portal protein [unclassified Lysinibacillus]SKC18416.1 phage portal protein, HK97 family [Lysinibacillus sp. AC-3]
MGIFETIFSKNKAVEFSFDLDFMQDKSKRLYMKKLTLDTCASFLARTIGQSEFRVKENGQFIKDELYYRLNLRPNKNQTASTFWQDIICKLIHENKALVVQSDDGDLLVADSFMHTEYAVFEDTFTDVTVKDFTFRRTFKQSDVMHLRYSNESLAPLIDGMYSDYGELFGRMLASQKRKNQIRSTVKVDANTAKNADALAKLQEFINKMYKAVGEKDVAIMPEQPGFEYKEHFSGSGNGIQSIDEINKITNGFFDQVATALGIPLPLIRGDMADVEKVTKNYMMYTINPLLKKIRDEINAKFFEKKDFLNGSQLDIKPVSYQNIFDLANAIDKLRSSGVVNGNEIRSELGLEIVEDAIMEEYFITKNYQTSSQAFEGGENKDEKTV